MEAFRLASGLEVLDRWSDSATQAERNVLYEALFSIVECAHDGRYVTSRDGDEFQVDVTPDLVLRARYDNGVFGLEFIGEPYGEDLPGAA